MQLFIARGLIEGWLTGVKQWKQQTLEMETITRLISCIVEQYL